MQSGSRSSYVGHATWSELELFGTESTSYTSESPFKNDNIIKESADTAATNRYGGREVTMAPIPYADLYGHPQGVRTTTIRDYVEKYMNGSSRAKKYVDTSYLLCYVHLSISLRSVLPYVFDGKILNENSDLAADLDLPEIVTAHNSVLRQFIMGVQVANCNRN